MTNGPTISFGHVPSLDGLRGVAVAAVVIYHLWPSALPGGFIGVDIFFVLSGFLLTSLLVREVDATGRVSVGRFFVRRMRRLLPAMLVLLTAVAGYALAWANPVEIERLRQHGVASLFYVANWLFVADGTTYTDVVAGASPLRHVWSLSIEEQFYLVLAVAVAVIATRTTSATLARRRVLIGACVLGSASALLMAGGSLAGFSADRLYFGADTRAQALLIGAALGAWRRGSPAPPSGRTSVATVLSFAVVAIIAATASESAAWMYRGGFTVVALAAGALIVGAPSVPHLRTVLEWRPLRALGAISYGVYLWHWPILVVFDQNRLGIDGITRQLTIIVMTLAIATLSYRWVEQPIRTGCFGKRWGAPAVGIGPVATAGVGALLVAATVAPSGLGADDVPDAVEIGAPVVITEVPDTTADPVGTTLPRPATSTAATLTTAAIATESAASAPTTPPDQPAAEPTRLVVIGDSVMHTLIGGRLSTGLDAEPWSPDQTTFDPQRIEIANVARPACSFLPGEIAFQQADGQYESASLSQFCGDWRDDLNKALTDSEQGDRHVVMVLLTNDLEDRRIDGQIVAVGTEQHTALLIDLVDQIRASTQAAGTPLILVLPAPRTVLGTTDLRGDREIVVRKLFADYAARYDGVSFVDLGEVLCPNDDCARPLGGFDPGWRYDGLHFSRNGAIWVGNWLTPQLEDIAAYS